MAQRKSAPASKTTSARPARSAAAKKSGSGQGARPGQGSPSQSKPGARSAAIRKPGKSIVNQKQTPWGLIATTVAIVLFAAVIVVVVVVTHKSSSHSAEHTTHGGQQVNANNPYTQPALPAAMAIKGVTYRVEGQHTHQDGTISYDSSPPVGGNHNQFWANCTGTVYSKQIANENAVHMLEHGAIWITYDPDKISGSQLTTLKKYVQGVDRTALSPYAGLKTPISLQAWGYQLFLNSPSDPRIAQFIKALKYNPKTTPENASCSDQYFKADESTPGHPFEGPSQ